MNVHSGLMLEFAPGLVKVFDRKHNCIDCNELAMATFEIKSKQEFAGKLYSLMPESQADGNLSRDAFGEMLTEAFETGKVIKEFMYRTASGRVFYGETTLTREILGDREFVISYTKDWTERKKLQEEVKEGHVRTKLILDSMPVACFLVRQDSSAIDCNVAAVRMFGFDDKAHAIKDCKKIFPAYHYLGEKAGFTLKNVTDKGSDHFEAEYLGANGEQIPCEVTLVKADYQGEFVVAVYIQDLRKIKAMAKELNRIDVAEKESMAKSQFLARMSHEIRTPLNVITGLAKIELQKGSHAPEIEETFLQIQNSAKLLLGIIDELLDLSKIAAGKMKIVNNAYETPSLIVDTVNFNMVYIGDKNISFNLEVDEKLPRLLCGDELRIKQILNNLLSNAFKYTDEGSVTLSFDFEENDTLVVAVEDTGMGMSAEDVETLFKDSFVRFHENEKRNIQGTGIGMSITSQLLGLMNGKISVESRLSHGSRFLVKIPQKPESAQPIGKDLAENLKRFKRSKLQNRRDFEYTPMPYGQVLIVDDVESNIYVAKGYLEPYLLSVDTAVSGHEALAKIKAGKVYDVILMDHMMPGMDGIETAKAIKELGYNKPIVALTANAVLGQAELFTSHGFEGFITKPIDVEQLNSYLIRLIRERHPKEVVETAEAAGANITNAAVPTERVAASFVRDARAALKTLSLSLEQNLEGAALKNYLISVHGIKSALANIGEKELSEKAQTLEDAGREAGEASIGFIKAKTASLLSNLEKLIEKTSKTFQSGEDASAADENPEFLRTHLAALCEACDAYDKRAARRALSEIGTKSWSSGTKAGLEQIAAYLLHSEFEEAAEAARMLYPVQT